MRSDMVLRSDINGRDEPRSSCSREGTTSRSHEGTTKQNRPPNYVFGNITDRAKEHPNSNIHRAMSRICQYLGLIRINNPADLLKNLKHIRELIDIRKG
jgi:hypothetical protein